MKARENDLDGPLKIIWESRSGPETQRMPVNHHAILAEEFCSQNIERADAAMRSHVMYGRDEVLNLAHPAFITVHFFEPEPFYFDDRLGRAWLTTA